MSDRNRVILEIKKIIVPELRNLGFKGSYPHFRRPNQENGFDLLSFQFNRWGGSFLIELSVAYPYREEYKNCYLLGLKPLEEEIKKLDVGNTFIRHRISARDDEWFHYENTDCGAVVTFALSRLLNEISWFQNPPIYEELERRKAKGLKY